METERRQEQINCRHREYEKENRRQTKRWHEIAEIFDDLTDEFMNLSRSVCEEENWMSLLNNYKSLRCVLIKEQPWNVQRIRQSTWKLIIWCSARRTPWVSNWPSKPEAALMTCVWEPLENPREPPQNPTRSPTESRQTRRKSYHQYRTHSFTDLNIHKYILISSF